MRRTTVFADEDDLAVIKAVAERRGIAEAELLREAIHLVAMANRTWDKPFFGESHVPTDEQRESDPAAAEESVWTEKVAAYRRTKNASS